jgi:cellulose synthase/poly-beta-1,6-N-acetylglucosamine synthase-like glycosyltransferase
MMWDWVLLLSLACVIYTYFGYPALLLVLGMLKSRRLQGEGSARNGYRPRVSVVIAAYNERRNIEKRLHNLLASDYPRELMEIIVVCDGCTDETAKLAAQFDGVRVIELTKRRGKSAAINVGVQFAQGEVVVFADARPLFARDTISRLVQVLADPHIGAVSGELILMAEDGTPRALGLYWRYEKALRSLETRVGSIVVCTGAVYAIRRALFTPIPEGLAVDDMWVPLHIVQKGYRVVFDRGAQAYDCLAHSFGMEFRRKVRTLAGNYQLLWAAPWLLVPWKNRLWWQFVSHKVCRLLVPYALIGMYGASWMLLAKPYGVALVLAQTGYYLLGAIAWMFPALARRFRLAGLAGSFLSLNAAAAVAPIAFLRGRGRVRWDRSPMMTPQTAGEEGHRVRTY